MSPPKRQPARGRRRLVEICPYVNERDRRPLPLDNHRYLHLDGHRLITTWFDRACRMRGDDASAFEGFVFAWIAVNARASCVTCKDRGYLKLVDEDK